MDVYHGADTQIFFTLLTLRERAFVLCSFGVGLIGKLFLIIFHDSADPFPLVFVDTQILETAINVLFKRSEQ